MYDINFFKQAFPIKAKISQGQYGSEDVNEILAEFENLRAVKPKVFNIETTNYCNMTCQMCPRTMLMTRKNIWIDDEVFLKVLDQMQPHKQEELEEFWSFITDTYGIKKWDTNENFFFFWIVSKCLILHGYGEPLLDKNIVDRVTACTDRNIPTYFSCVPANITVKRAESVMKAGLTVLKFSMDGLDDETQKAIRGKKNNFSKSFDAIKEILELKKRKNYRTLIVLTMIALSDDPDSRKLHQDFMELWKDYDVFAYVKSQDNRWYYEDEHVPENKSHYERQYCENPWTSLTVMADGSVVPCTQDYDAEMVMGNVREETLEEIWNGPKYKAFREMHATGNFPPGHKCAERCDHKILHQFIPKKDP